jgi:low temperature requirement protein LtrA
LHKSRTLLRSRDSHARVTFVELFFDLVFVFAVTQLSHTLVEHLTLIGALQTLFLLLAVWWVWMYTCWFTNWVDPDRPPVRALIFVLMLAGLLLSASLPHAFDGEALLFASAYVFSQLVRSAFMLWASHGHDDLNFKNFRRIISWQMAAAVFWLAGGFCGGATRVLLWVTALGIECVGPYAGFYVPGLGRSGTIDWRVDGAHMAERSALFVIIALGESILVTGATAAAQPATSANIGAFVCAFVGSVAMWWIYFNIGAERGSHQIAHSDDPGRVARAVYTYFHIPIVAGIVVCAVADEITIKHAVGHMELSAAATLLGGPALYLAGNILFKRASARYYPLSHLVGLGLLLLLTPVARFMTPLALGAATTAILVIVAVWETWSFAKGPRPESQRVP